MYGFITVPFFHPSHRDIFISTMSNGDFRVPIPTRFGKVIHDIREITGKQQSDDDIYSVLKECNMDPNETAQKLLYLVVSERSHAPSTQPVAQKTKSIGTSHSKSFLLGRFKLDHQ